MFGMFNNNKSDNSAILAQDKYQILDFYLNGSDFASQAIIVVGDNEPVVGRDNMGSITQVEKELVPLDEPTTTFDGSEAIFNSGYNENSTYSTSSYGHQLAEIKGCLVIELTKQGYLTILPDELTAKQQEVLDEFHNLMGMYNELPGVIPVESLEGEARVAVR